MFTSHVARYHKLCATCFRCDCYLHYPLDTPDFLDNLPLDLYSFSADLPVKQSSMTIAIAATAGAAGGCILLLVICGVLILRHSRTKSRDLDVRKRSVQ